MYSWALNQKKKDKKGAENSKFLANEKSLNHFNIKLTILWNFFLNSNT